MRLKQGTTEPKSRAAMNAAKEEINISDSPAQNNINKKENKDEEDVEENDILTEALQNLRLESSSESRESEHEKDDESEEDEEEEEEAISADEIVAKCPTRTKDTLKENNKAKASPYASYPYQQRFFSYNSQTGGDVIIENQGYKPNIPASEYIPEPVLEYSTDQSSLLSSNDVELFIKGLPSEYFTKLDEAYKSIESNANIMPAQQQHHQSNNKYVSDPNEYCNSPQDSSYGTLSPASVPSPHTLHSPNPNIPAPKYESSLSIDSDTSLSSFQQSDFDYLGANETTYQYNQETSKWVIPQLQKSFNIPISQHSTGNHENNVDILSNASIVQQDANKTDLTNNSLYFSGAEAPVQRYVVSRSSTQPIQIQPIQDSTCTNIQPTGEPVSSIRLLVPQEPKKYTQLLPAASNRVGARNIRPGGISVSEVDLDTPSVDRLKKQLVPRDKDIAWTIVCLEKEHEISSINDLNQTKLMQILQERPSKQFLEKIFARVQRIKKEKRKELLQHRDNNGQTALYMAIFLQKQNPVLSRFIADSYIELNLNPEEVYGKDENTAVHIIAEAGDSYAQVLADLLRVTNENREKAFDVNRRNRKSLTPLHIAARSHLVNSSTLAVTQLLVKNGALITKQDEDGKTPLHLAIQYSCDPILIKALLQSPHAQTCVNIPDKKGNTPLHTCTARDDVFSDKNKEVINQLLTSGASRNIHNLDGRLAVSLVAPEKRQEVKSLLNKKHPILLSL